MEDKGIKSIRYPVEADEKLAKLALKLGRTKKLLFMQMIDYFYKSKKDPTDLNDELLKKELVNGNSRIISFIKRQETDFLLPVFTSGGVLTTIAKEHTKYFKAISGHLVDEAKKTDQLAFRINTMEKGIARTHHQIEEKAALKNRFKKVLEYYITHRESLGWPVSANKKDELQNHVRQSLENL